jgi:hypothetical protein
LFSHEFLIIASFLSDKTFISCHCNNASGNDISAAPINFPQLSRDYWHLRNNHPAVAIASAIF